LHQRGVTHRLVVDTLYIHMMFIPFQWFKAWQPPNRSTWPSEINRFWLKPHWSARSADSRWER
jgi:hypothetical protein